MQDSNWKSAAKPVPVAAAAGLSNFPKDAAVRNAMASEGSASILTYLTSPSTTKWKRDPLEDVQESRKKSIAKLTAGPTERNSPTPAASAPDELDMSSHLRRIQVSSKTPFQKRVLTLLCQVPRGQYTTYGAMAKHLSSSARAVGNALRNNPFAPDVPCHRVLATGGGLGGFGGCWGRKGEAGVNDQKKLKLLRAEGVRFDGKGKVAGSLWQDFV